MRYVGIDIGSATHYAAVVDDNEDVVMKSRSFEEDASGYAQLLEWLGDAEGVLVAMEATGHYWQNLYAALVARDFAVSLINPIRTRRFADEDLKRAKTDRIDALLIARFAVQKKLAATRMSDGSFAELKELVSLRDRLVQDMGDRERQLHRAVDLGFPEFTSFIKDLSTYKATALLREFPTAQAFARAHEGTVAKIQYDPQKHLIGRPLAKDLISAAKRSVGAHHGEPYRLQVQYFCEDIRTLRGRISRLEEDIGNHVMKSDVCKRLTTIEGIGPNTSARIVAAVGDPGKYRDGAALAAYAGVVPAVRHSGMKQPLRGSCHPTGNADLRAKLWMPTLVAVRKNPWLKAFYERLISKGKPAKVALLAAMRKLLHAVYSVSKNEQDWVFPKPKDQKTGTYEAAAPQTA